LPGDIPAAPAAQFGFASRGSYAGEGDGNGFIEGIAANAPGSNWGGWQTTGETPMFWVDLSTVNLIDGGFNTASETTPPVHNIVSGSALNNYLPAAKIGGGNYILIMGQAPTTGNPTTLPYNGNYFMLSAISTITYATTTTSIVETPGLTVAQAHAIDTKMDDGLPQNGNVFAAFRTYSSGWVGVTPGTAATGSSTTCYDNAGSASNTMQYSMAQNKGASVNCALSFKLQAGDQ
jgi:hypothetical protein